MTNEMAVLKEMASISSLRLEWSDFTSTILEQITSSEFVAQYELMNRHVLAAFDGLLTPLAPFLAIQEEEAFFSEFDQVAAHYQENFLNDAGKPRLDADAAFEAFIPIQQSKEFATGYPLLKQAFDRLDFAMDKYISNDAWLLMSIDTVFKRFSRWLMDLAQLKKMDREDAWRVYQGVVGNMGRFIEVIKAIS